MKVRTENQKGRGGRGLHSRGVPEQSSNYGGTGIFRSGPANCRANVRKYLNR